MSAPTRQTFLRKLVETLTELSTLFDRRVEIANRRVAAMRGADVDALKRYEEEDRALGAEVQKQDRRRQEYARSLARVLDIPAAEVGSVSVSSLSGLLDGQEAASLRAAGQSLRERIAAFAGLDRVASTTAATIAAHLAWILQAVRPKPVCVARYDKSGGIVGEGESLIVDAVG